MDGPSTNWNVLDLIDNERAAGNLPRTINIGSCSLHILHGAFQTGFTNVEWLISVILRAMFKLFDESPARRDIYLNQGSSELFPLKFSATRWIEDKPVAERALEVWSSVTATIKHWKSLCKSSQPKNRSYETLLEHHKNRLIPARFAFFSFIAGILKPFLVIFQSDNPLVPFLYDELSQIVYRLVRLVYKQSKLEDTAQLSEIMNKEFLMNPENQLEEYLVDIGSATKDLLASINTANEKKRRFRGDCKNVVINILLKLTERLPTNKLLVVTAASLSPNNMAKSPDQSQKRFKSMADNLFSLKFITSPEADNAKFQFDEFMSNEVLRNKDKFLEFNFKDDRVDEFLYKYVGANKDYVALWKVMKLVFILSHGQSYTERGFSVNKLTTDVNMESESLIAQRFIYDAMKNANADASTFPITNEMKQSCKKARMRSVAARENKKKDSVTEERNRKRTLKKEEVEGIKKKKLDVTETINTLKKSLYEEAILSAQRNGKEHATKAASFAKSLKEKESLYDDLCGIQEKLENEYKALLQ